MSRRIVIFEEEQRRLQEVCTRLGRDALAQIVFLIDQNGQILAATGELGNIDQTSFASLVAGTTAATSSLAGLLGEEAFPVHFHEGATNNLHISLVGEEYILVVVFDHRSSLGLIRLRVKKATATLLEIFETVTSRQDDSQENDVFSEITDEDIENLFSDSF